MIKDPIMEMFLHVTRCDIKSPRFPSLTPNQNIGNLLILIEKIILIVIMKQPVYSLKEELKTSFTRGFNH